MGRRCFFFASLLLLWGALRGEQLVPLAGAILFLGLWFFEYFRFIFFLFFRGSRGKSGYRGTGLSCPVLPCRMSDALLLGEAVDFPDVGRDVFLTFSLTLKGGCGELRRFKAEAGGGPCLPRGIFSVVCAELVLEDPCRFFVFKLKGRGTGGSAGGEAPGGAVLRVYPRPLTPEVPPPLAFSSIPRGEAFLSPLRNGDFSESRPYVPGDDPRRIHWKMLARHGEIFVKEGHPAPSLSPEVLLIWEGRSFRSLGKRGSRAFRQEEAAIMEAEVQMRRLAGLLELLTKGGFQVRALFPGKGLRAGLESMSPEEQQDLLASIPSRPLSSLGGLAFDSGAPALIYNFAPSGKRNAWGNLKELYPRAICIRVLPDKHWERKLHTGRLRGVRPWRRRRERGIRDGRALWQREN